MVVFDVRCVCGGPHFVFFLWTPLADTMKEKSVLCFASTRQTGSALAPLPPPARSEQDGSVVGHPKNRIISSVSSLLSGTLGTRGCCHT